MTMKLKFKSGKEIELTDEEWWELWAVQFKQPMFIPFIQEVTPRNPAPDYWYSTTGEITIRPC